jgi:hypothetical protein
MSTDVIDCLDLSQLEQLRDAYATRHDRASEDRVRAAIGRKGLIQTDELYRSGKLYAHEMPRDNSGRVVTAFTGDPAAWMSAFQHHGVKGKFNTELATEAARAAERAQREAKG